MGWRTITDDQFFFSDLLNPVLEYHCLEAGECRADSKIEFDASVHRGSLSIVQRNGMLSRMNNMSTVNSPNQS